MSYCKVIVHIILKMSCDVQNFCHPTVQGKKNFLSKSFLITCWKQYCAGLNVAYRIAGNWGLL